MLLPSPILVICAGNICRSPFAEAYLRKQIELAGVYAEVFSRGLLTLPKQNPPTNGQQVAVEFGVDISKHLSQPLSRSDLDRAAMVLVMDVEQRQHIGKINPAAIGRVFVLSQMTDGKTIPDPMGENKDAFRRSYSIITKDVDEWVKRFGITPAKL